MDNLMVKQVLQDEALFELNFTARSKLLSAKARILAQNKQLQSEPLRKYAVHPNNNLYWEIADVSLSSHSQLILKMLYEGKLGYTVIELELCFALTASEKLQQISLYVHSDMGLLSSLCKSMPAVSKPVLDGSSFLC